MADAMDALVGFAAELRRAGVPASPDRVQACAAALDALRDGGAPEPGALYWAGRLTLCGCADDVERYDLAYSASTAQVRPLHAPPPRGTVRRLAVPFGLDSSTMDDAASVDTPMETRASGHELLRRRDIGTLSTVERDEVRRLLALLRPVAPMRPGRRYRAAHTGQIDARRSLAAQRHALGEPARLRHRRHRDRPRRLVLLVDVSGSMAPYADALLRFGHAALRARPAATEVFTLGTRLTRVTRALAHRDPDAALAAAGEDIPDWRGGTRLGSGIDAFVRRYAHPGLARRAVVVVCSDGWERGDPALLADAMARLRRLAHRIVWVTPHRGRPGFAPTAGGLAAVLPYLHSLVAGHSLDALADLVREVAADA